MIDKNVEICKNLVNTIRYQIRDTSEDRYIATLNITEGEADGITKGLLAEYETHMQYLKTLDSRLQKDYEGLLRRQ